MSKDPAFLFYSNDFLTGTYTMTDEQVGKYVRLLCLQHQKGHLSEKDMLTICKTYDEDIYSKFIKDGDMYYNERLKHEADKRSAYSESRRRNKQKAIGNEHINIISSSYDNHMENENENENVITIFNDVQNAKQLIYAWQSWKDYKKGQFKFTYKTTHSEITALKNLKTLSHGKDDIAIAIINQSIANGWKGLFATNKSKANDERYAARVDYANRHD